IVVIFPESEPVVQSVLDFPFIGPALKSLQLNVFLVEGLGISGEYAAGKPAPCFFGASSIDVSGTLGLELELAFNLKTLGIPGEFSIYGGGTGTPEIEVCPELAPKDIKLQAYAGLEIKTPGGLDWHAEVKSPNLTLRSDGSAGLEQVVVRTVQGAE